MGGEYALGGVNILDRADTLGGEAGLNLQPLSVTGIGLELL